MGFCQFIKNILIYNIIKESLMITQFFKAPFQNFSEDPIQLQQCQDLQSIQKNRSFIEKMSNSEHLRAEKLQTLQTQIAQLIDEIVIPIYEEQLKSLHNSEYLKVKNTKHEFFGETSIQQNFNSLFKAKSRVAEGLCELFFDNGSYLIGYFEKGYLQGQFVHILQNGNYIKAKHQKKMSKRSISGFRTANSYQLESEQTSSDDNRIDEDDIKVNFSKQKIHAIDHFLNLQAEIFYQGIYYKGTIKNGQLNGKVFQKGSDYQFTGNFYNGQRKLGKLKSNFGLYQGTFKNNKFDGLGTLVTKDGVYSGQFKNGLKDGQGQFKWQDGSIYKGDFQKDLRSGKGFFKSEQGSFKGQWRNDQINGAGYLIIGPHGKGGQWRKDKYQMPNKFF